MTALYILEPEPRDSGPILVCDENHNDIAEFFHSEHATVPQSYEYALQLAQKLVGHESYDRDEIAKCLFNTAMAGHAQWNDMSVPNKEDWLSKADKWICEVSALKGQGARFKAGGVANAKQF